MLITKAMYMHLFILEDKYCQGSVSICEILKSIIFQSTLPFSSSQLCSIVTMPLFVMLFFDMYKCYCKFNFFFGQAIGAAVGLSGNVSFINNNAKGFDGGALYMLTSSQIILNNATHLEFVNNTGGYDTLIVL